jgi:hypothetical protein
MFAPPNWLTSSKKKKTLALLACFIITCFFKGQATRICPCMEFFLTNCLGQGEKIKWSSSEGAHMCTFYLPADFKEQAEPKVFTIMCVTHKKIHPTIKLCRMHWLCLFFEHSMVFLCSTQKCLSAQKIKPVLTKHLFVGPAYQGKDIMFRFIIEYSNLMDFGR